MVGFAMGFAFVTPAQAGKIQFGLAELPGDAQHGDSFVVAIDESQTELIAHARALIQWVNSGADPENSPGATILVADIAAGADGINRNYLGAGEPLWSWHIVGTPSFGDITIEILDGWPTFVEEDVQGWIDNTNGAIGFWNYTVVAELGQLIPEPSSAGLAMFAAACLAGGALGRRHMRRARI
jgi:hypothetical protein